MNYVDKCFSRLGVPKHGVRGVTVIETAIALGIFLTLILFTIHFAHLSIVRSSVQDAANDLAELIENHPNYWIDSDLCPIGSSEAAAFAETQKQLLESFYENPSLKSYF